MSRSKARLAADWFAKLRINAQTQEVEHADVATVEAEVVAVSDSVSTTVSSQLTSVASDVATKLDSSTYTAADVLAKVKTVDGSGSGLDADTVDGLQASQLGVPSGVIVMWSGSVASVPSGWAICNGLNGTPNLTGRFVVHADADTAGTYNVGATGGASTVALTAAQMASHTHNFAANATTGGGGDHAHNGSTSNIGNHSHTLGNGQMDKYAGWANVSAWPVFNHSRLGPYSTSEAGSHSHNFTTGNSGNHTHNLSVSGATGSTGTGDAHENRPPYYALAYIMKL